MQHFATSAAHGLILHSQCLRALGGNCKQTMKSQACYLCALSLSATASGFVRVSPTGRISAVRPTSMSQAEHVDNANTESLEKAEERSLLSNGGAADICAQFKILTCTSNACSQKRQILQMDQYATFSALYSRKEEAGGPYAMVDVEESPCLGRCKLAPCVAVEHEDYVGTVGLVGMTDAELNDRVFHRIITDEDCDRVWKGVVTGIRMMAEEQADD